MPKGERESRFRGSVDKGFHFFFVCYIHASCFLSRPAFCDMCACEVRESYVIYLVTLLYHVTFLVLAHKVVLLCLTSILYELCFMCTIFSVLSYEYTLLGWNT
jgi:hypothetical protein